MEPLRSYSVRKIGNNRGRPRVWLEGAEVAKAGFEPGARYDVQTSEGAVRLSLSPSGSRVVSAKRAGDEDRPIIDINSGALLAAFDGMACVRVVAIENEIWLQPLASEIKKAERMGRLRRKLEAGEPLAVGSLSHGGGVLSHALHAGLAEGGVESAQAFANEIRPELLEHAARANSAWSASTIPLAAPMQELANDDEAMARLPKVDILEMGLPCSGASKSGRAKRGLEKPEDHPEVGHLVVSALAILGKVNPALVVFENVVDYSTSASASILRSQLRDLGYSTHEKVFSGRAWGAMEDRKRWCMVAATDGVPFTFDQLSTPAQTERRLGELLEAIADDDPRWSRMQGLKDKEVRDRAAGKGFKMQVFGADSEKIGTITKGYSKVRSTDPKIAHPSDPELLRQLTPAEHARVKGVPPALIEGLPLTVAHQILGQGIAYPPFQALGRHIGATLRGWDGKPAALPARAPDGLLSAAGVVVAEIRLASDIGSRCAGPIVAIHGDALIQDVGAGPDGRPIGALHFASDFAKPPALGERASIEYRDGAPRCRVEQLSLDL